MKGDTRRQLWVDRELMEGLARREQSGNGIAGSLYERLERAIGSPGHIHEFWFAGWTWLSLSEAETHLLKTVRARIKPVGEEDA